MLIENGCSFEELNIKIKEWLEHVNYAGIMFTLENLVRTGRVPKTKKYLADFFKIKPIVQFVDGQVSIQDKIRANDQHIINQMKKYGCHVLDNLIDDANHIFIGHTRWPEAAEIIAKHLEENNSRKMKIIIQETGAIVANFVGKKALTFGYIGSFDKNWLLDAKKITLR